MLIPSEHCFSGGPSTLAALMDGRPLHPASLGPFHKSQCLAIDSEPRRITSVPALFGSSGPPAVIWRVITVIINAVDRVLRCRALTHVGKEILETRSPSSTYRNAAATVICKGPVRTVLATVDHVAPAHVERRPLTGPTVAMLSIYHVR